MTTKQRWQFVVYMVLLFHFVKKYDKLHLVNLNEPHHGNPLVINYKNHYVGQDVLNSILETNSIAQVFPKTNKKIHIMELGAGYGRNAYVVFHVYKNAQLFIVDIPPALLIAEWYLSKVFPKKKIFYCKDFKTYSSIKKHIEHSDIIFLLPSQVRLLPKKSIDLFYTISSIHEMQPKQIKKYFKDIDRLVNGIFYFKQWKVSKNPYDNIIIKQHEYPVKTSWKKLFHREAKVQSQFFEAAYKIH